MEAGGESQPARGSVEVIEPSTNEQSVARGVAESKATAPHVSFIVEGSAPSAAAAIRASALALREVPRANGAYRDGRFEVYSRVNVGLVVIGKEGSAVPVVHDADTKDLEAVAGELERLVGRVRAGAITRPELSGGTFTVVMPQAPPVGALTPILQRGQAATLGVGSSLLTLSCDARILQRNEGPALLARLTELLSDPASL